MEVINPVKRVVVVGLGYIGLPTAAMFASRRVSVLGVDISQKIVDTINNGETHIIEPDLDDAVSSSVNDGFLKAATIPDKGDVFIIAVPTPFKEGNRPNLDYIKAACDSISPFLEKGNLVILESTSPVGTTEKVSEWLCESRPDLAFPHNGALTDIFIAHCPERVLPGKVMKELIENDRIIGGITEACAQKSSDLYTIFVKGNCIRTDSRTAELAKLTENSFRDVNIALANELSIICDKLDIDVGELISLANRHPRVNILNPGCGVGGHCIAVDPWFIVDSAPDHSDLIRTARLVNDAKPVWVINKVKTLVMDFALEKNKSVQDVKVACLGVAYKPNIDDLRESPALRIFKELNKFDFQCVAVEPNLDASCELMEEISLVPLSQAMKEANILVHLVSHNEFADIDNFVNQNEQMLVKF